MISGVVRHGEARVVLSVIGPRKAQQQIEAVIDTGFTASLTLPPKVIKSLKLNWKCIGRGILADGSQCLFDVFVADVLWDGKAQRVLINEADTDPLLGMDLLSGYELKMKVRERGKVTITRLPREKSS